MAQKRVDVLYEFEHNTVALFTVNSKGELIRDRIHPAGEHAPFHLIGFAREDSKEEKVLVAEVGVSRAHPYNALSVLGFPPRLPKRKPLGSFDITQVRNVSPALTRLLNELVKARIPGWRSPVETEWWHDRYLRGISVSVSHASEDAALLRFFEEWELLNMSLDYRLARLAWRLNREPGNNRIFRRTKRHRYSQSFNIFKDLLDGRHGIQTRVLLRPHILGELGRWLRYPMEFFDFLFQENVIDGACAAYAMETMGVGARETYGFKILPREVKQWQRKAIHEKHEQEKVLAVYPLSMTDAYVTFRITVTGRQWTERRERLLDSARKSKAETDLRVASEPWRDW